MEWLGVQDLTAKDYFLALPWLFIILGRLVPHSRVREVWDLYYKSEASRERGVAAMERGADAIEATNRLVKSTLAPIEERAHEPRQ